MTNIKIYPLFKLLIIGLVFVILVSVSRVVTSKNEQKSDFEPLTEQTEPIDETADWTTYEDEQGVFSFKYPPELDDACCTMGGAASEDIYFEKVIVDADTLNSEVLDDPFAGVAIYVIETEKTFEKYLADEKEALHLQEKDYILYMSTNEEGFDEEFVDDGVEEKITLHDKELIVLKNYSWDKIERYYYPVPDSNYVLVLGKSSKESEKFTFEEIFSTFEFSDSE